MYNDLFTIGSLTIHGYGLMIALGLILALALSDVRAKRKGLSTDAVESMVLIAIITGFLGAKLLYIIVHFGDFLASPMSVIGSEGFVAYGGIIFGTFCVWAYNRRKGLPFLRYFDLLMPAVALGQGFGRLGCFLAGCCYGSPTDSALGVVFPEGSMAPAGIKLWPAQLFSAGGDFVICVILLCLSRKKRRSGLVGTAYLLLYAVGRFVVEFFRSDARGTVGALSTSQFISILILIFALGLLVALKKRPEAETTADEAEEAADTGSELSAEPAASAEADGEPLPSEPERTEESAEPVDAEPSQPGE